MNESLGGLDVSDELAKRISERQEKERAAKAALEAKQEAADKIARTVPPLWATAYAPLNAALTTANHLFSDKGERRHFRCQPQPQPHAGNHACLVIHHREPGNPGDISQTVITVSLNGIVYVSHPAIDRKYEVSKLARKDWDTLLADIYHCDVN